MPIVVFTISKIGSVGLSEAQVIEKGYLYQIVKVDISNWQTYKRTNDSYAMAKVIVDKESDRILGTHIIGNQADELINIFTVAIKFGLPAKELKYMIFAYPTVSSDIEHMLP